MTSSRHHAASANGVYFYPPPHHLSIISGFKSLGWLTSCWYMNHFVD